MAVQTLATLAADPIASLVDTAYLGRYGAPCRCANCFIVTSSGLTSTEPHCRLECLKALLDAFVADTCMQVAVCETTHKLCVSHALA